MIDEKSRSDFAPAFDATLLLSQKQFSEKKQILQAIRFLNLAIEDCNRTLAAYDKRAARQTASSTPSCH